MKKNGFTLIEILGVVVIIAVLSLIVYPLIANQFKKNQNDISKVTRTLLEEAASTYLDSKPNQYVRTNGNIYCVSLSELVTAGNLILPLKDTATGEEIPTSNKIKITVENNQFIPKYIGDDSCTELRN